jgi:hypothetical protein
MNGAVIYAAIDEAKIEAVLLADVATGGAVALMGITPRQPLNGDFAP